MGNLQSIIDHYFNEWKDKIEGLKENPSKYNENDIYQQIQSQITALELHINENHWDVNTPLNKIEFSQMYNQLIHILCFLWPILEVAPKIKDFIHKYNKDYSTLKSKLVEMKNELVIIHQILKNLKEYHVALIYNGNIKWEYVLKSSSNQSNNKIENSKIESFEKLEYHTNNQYNFNQHNLNGKNYPNQNVFQQNTISQSSTKPTPSYPLPPKSDTPIQSLTNQIKKLQYQQQNDDQTIKNLKATIQKYKSVNKQLQNDINEYETQIIYLNDALIESRKNLTQNISTQQKQIEQLERENKRLIEINKELTQQLTLFEEPQKIIDQLREENKQLSEQYDDLSKQQFKRDYTDQINEIENKYLKIQFHTAKQMKELETKMETIQNEEEKKNKIIQKLLRKEHIRLIKEDIVNKFPYVLYYTIKTINGSQVEYYYISEKLINCEFIVLPIVVFNESRDNLDQREVKIDMSKYDKNKNELFEKNRGSEIIKRIKYHIVVKFYGENIKDEFDIENYIRTDFIDMKQNIEKNENNEIKENNENEIIENEIKEEVQNEIENENNQNEENIDINEVENENIQQYDNNDNNEIQQQIQQYSIPIPIQIMYMGGNCDIPFGENNYQIQIPQFCPFNYTISLNETIRFVLETVSNEQYRREGDDLLMILTIDKSFEGNTITPQLFSNQFQLPEIIINEGTFDIGEYGFIKNDYSGRGHLYLIISFIESTETQQQ